MILRANLVELEGLAMIGEIERIEIKDCKEIKGYKEIVVYTKDEKRLSSGCIEADAARRNYSVLALYAKKWHINIVRNDLIPEESKGQI